MVDNAIQVEYVLIKKGDISPWKETQPGSSSREKNKYWKYGKDNNKNIVNDGVVDTVKANSKPTIFNLASGTQELKAAEAAVENPPKKTKEWFKEKPWLSKPMRDFTPLKESYESAFKTLLANNLIILPDNSWPYDLEIKPKWWRETEYCDFHRNKGHNTNNCMKLKHEIQDLIDAG